MWGSSLWEISGGDSPTELVYIHCQQDWLGRHLGDTPLNVPVRVSTDVTEEGRCTLGVGSTIICTEALDKIKKKKKEEAGCAPSPFSP